MNFMAISRILKFGPRTATARWQKFESSWLLILGMIKAMLFVCRSTHILMRYHSGSFRCRPIKTYGHQGVIKHGVRPQDHAVIYSSKRRGPVYLPGERDPGLMTLEPIRVEMSQNHFELYPLSRLNYANPHTIEDNVKVCFIGRVAKPYERQLRKDFARISAHYESDSINTRDMNQSVDATSGIYSNQGRGGLDERYRPKNGAGYVQVTAEGRYLFRQRCTGLINL